MTEKVAVNAQLYCGQCGWVTEAQIDTGAEADSIWIAAKETGWEHIGKGFVGPPRPAGVRECAGCIPEHVAVRSGVAVYYELIWAWLALFEGL